MAVLLSPADLSSFHMSADYIFTLFLRGSIFLPPLACGFTLPLGDSRWGSPMQHTLLFRAFPAKHPLS